MFFDLSDYDRNDRYKLIASAIIPRPIALVTTLGPNGICNAAPFSAFNYMSEDPPLVAIGLQVRPDGSPHAGAKDTTRNVSENGEFVAHLVDTSLTERMVACATEFPPDASEPALTGFTLEPSVKISVPRLRECPIAMECRRVTILNFSNRRAILIGEVLAMHYRDDLIDPKTLRVDLARYNPVGRLMGTGYCSVGEVVSIPVMSYAAWQERNPDA